MSLAHSPSFVTDSLVLFLDAQNIKSYNGTTTWSDISGQGNHGTMFGTVASNTTGIAYYDFAGATTPNNLFNANMGFSFASNMVTTTGDFTLSVWVKDIASTIGQNGLFGNTGSADGWRFGVAKNGVYWLIGPTYREGNIYFITPISDSNWHNVVAVFKRSALVIDVYLDGVYQASSVPLYSPQTAFTNTAPGLVRNGCCTPIYTGKISILTAHNKALSATEINTNFNALRGRFLI